MNETASEAGAGTSGLNPDRLFLGSCVALIATSVAFATVSAVMFALKGEFVLTNAEVGWIGGAAIWGFAVSQVVFRAPLRYPRDAVAAPGWHSSGTSAAPSS